MAYSEADFNFLSHTPNAKSSKPPENLALVAEDLGTSIRLVMGMLDNLFPGDQPGDQLNYTERLRQAMLMIERFVNDIQQSGNYAAISLIHLPIKAERLSIVSSHQPAFLEERVTLRPHRKYPINYYGIHRLLTPSLLERHSLASTSNEEQLFLGFIPPENPYNGYAISLAQFFRGRTGFSAVPVEGFEEGIGSA